MAQVLVTSEEKNNDDNNDEESSSSSEEETKFETTEITIDWNDEKIVSQIDQAFPRTIHGNINEARINYIVDLLSFINNEIRNNGTAIRKDKIYKIQKVLKKELEKLRNQLKSQKKRQLLNHQRSKSLMPSQFDVSGLNNIRNNKNNNDNNDKNFSKNKNKNKSKFQHTRQQSQWILNTNGNEKFEIEWNQKMDKYCNHHSLFRKEKMKLYQLAKKWETKYILNENEKKENEDSKDETNIDYKNIKLLIWNDIYSKINENARYPSRESMNQLLNIIKLEKSGKLKIVISAHWRENSEDLYFLFVAMDLVGIDVESIVFGKTQVLSEKFVNFGSKCVTQLEIEQWLDTYVGQFNANLKMVIVDSQKFQRSKWVKLGKTFIKVLAIRGISENDTNRIIECLK